jgi:hypothetical protein
MPRPKPEDVLRWIEEAPTTAAEDAARHGAPDALDAVVDAEMDRVLALSPEARRRELEAEGIDVDELHAMTAAVIEGKPLRALAVPMPPPGPLDAAPGRAGRVPSRRRRAAYLLVAAVLVTLAAAAAAVALRPDGSNAPKSPPLPPATSAVPEPPPSRAPGPDIAMLRRDAVDACHQTRWQACLAGLDLARRYDPAGESDPVVALARRQAEGALTGGDADTDFPKKGPGTP